MAPAQGPPPQFQQAREAAKTAALNDLSPDHRAKVQAIAQQVQSGSLSVQDAAKQIDGILSANETQAVLSEQQNLRANAADPALGTVTVRPMRVNFS